MIKVYPNGLKKAHDTDAQAHANINALGKYQNVVVIEPLGNGDYTTLSAALAAITDASATNRYGVIMMPGVYPITATLDICKDGVDIIGLIPHTVVVTSASSLSNGMVRIGADMTTTQIVRGVDFVHTGNNTTDVIKCNATEYTGTVRFEDCLIEKQLGSGNAYEPNGSMTIEFHNCKILHTEVTSSARYLIPISQDSGADVCKITDCDLRVSSSHADAACFYDSLGLTAMQIYCFQSRLRASKIVVSASGNCQFSIALCVLSVALDAGEFTNNVTTPGNVVDALFS